jgi:hypothetical protein
MSNKKKSSKKKKKKVTNSKCNSQKKLSDILPKGKFTLSPKGGK